MVREKLMIVGEDFGYSYQRVLRMSGLNREEVREINLRTTPVKDIPKTTTILTLGDRATAAITGMAGEKKTLRYLRGYPIETWWGLAIPTYDPQWVISGQQKLMGVAWLDFMKAKQINERGHSPLPLDYHTQTTLMEAKELYYRLMAKPDNMIGFDIETEYSAAADEDELHKGLNDEEEDEEGGGAGTTEISPSKPGRILSIQFSTHSGEGYYFPWIGEYSEVARLILSLPNPKVGHNVLRFDLLKLRENTVLVNGLVHDTMWMFHHSQPDLVGHFNLQSVASFFGHDFPWKHLSSQQPEFYGCVDVDVLHRIMDRLPEEMKNRKIWDGYMRHILQLDPILLRASERGMPINEPNRLALRVELLVEKEAINQKLQEAYPDELKTTSPEEGYVREPEDKTGLRLLRFNVQLDETEWVEVGCKCKRKHCTKCNNTGIIKKLKKTGKAYAASVERWAKIDPFKPSATQMLKYMEFHGHPLQKHIKEARNTTDVKALERLAKITKDPFYRTVLDYRQTEKILSTYVDGWQPSTDGRVHTTFLYKPATGQLSSVNPNIQNATAGKGKDAYKEELAKRFRRIIEAPPGHTLVEADYHSFHGMTMGFCARDSQYMRLANLDMHSFLTSHMVKEPADFDWSDHQLLEYFQYIKGKYKALRDTQAKPAGLGAQFGMQANTLYRNNEDCFSCKAEAQAILDLLDRLFPKVAQFKQDIVHLAQKQKHLISPFGYIRWFWEALKWDFARGCYVNGRQAEAAMAFLPANIAFGHKKEAILALEKVDALERFGFINDIHDSLLFCCADGLVDECASTTKELMERPSLVLVDEMVAPKGLVVAVDVKVGHNWAEMSNWS